MSLEIDKGLVGCPSVFGVYPTLPSNGGYVSLGGGVPMLCVIHRSIWENGNFGFQFTLGNYSTAIELVIHGGASSPRVLSQAVFSQCIEACQRESLLSCINPEALSDFIFDQLVPSSMKGLFRQHSGIGDTVWLSTSAIYELSLRLDNLCLLLGEILMHPAAHLASKWKSSSPLGGVHGRLPNELCKLLVSSEHHFRAGGCLVVGPATQRNIYSAEDEGFSIPNAGWIVTGRRGGVEALARSIARESLRPLVIASRLEDVEVLKFNGSFNNVVADTSGKPIGPFRQNLLKCLKLERHTSLHNSFV